MTICRCCCIITKPSASIPCGASEQKEFNKSTAEITVIFHFLQPLLRPTGYCYKSAVIKAIPAPVWTVWVRRWGPAAMQRCVKEERKMVPRSDCLLLAPLTNYSKMPFFLYTSLSLQQWKHKNQRNGHKETKTMTQIKWLESNQGMITEKNPKLLSGENSLTKFL